MTYCCITCEFDKARANNAPGRRNLRPMIPPVAVTRDTAAGATTSAATPQWAPEPLTSPGLGSRVAAAQTSSVVTGETVTHSPECEAGETTLDTYPGSRGRVSGLPGHAGHVAARAAAAMEAPTVGAAS